MLLKHITLRNCRLHRLLEIDLQRSLNLIGGPNETGKSTLIEAVHRALFLKARGNSAHHRALESTHGGIPEVEVSFESSQITYSLIKRFGSNGSTTLSSSDARRLSGDAAEAELARILGVQPGATGTAVPGQWGHLWVWQGHAGDDPSPHATARHQSLLRRLQRLGGAAVLQSDLDARLSLLFSQERSRLLTQADKPKTGSEWDLAETAWIGATQGFNLAQERLTRLERSISDFEQATQTLADATLSLQGLDQERIQAEEKARLISELRTQESAQSATVKGASDRLDAIVESDTLVSATRASIANVEQELDPQTRTLKQFEDGVKQAKDDLNTAESNSTAASTSARTARLRQEVAREKVRWFEQSAVLAGLVRQHDSIVRCRTGLASLSEDLSKLAKIDRSKLQTLQTLESTRNESGAALRAIATGLEIVASAEPIILGSGPALEVGATRILVEDTELQIGIGTRVMIRPGGGTSLADARQRQDEAASELQRALDSYGLQSVREATEVLGRRDDINARIKALEAELKGMGADEFETNRGAAQEGLTATEATLNRLSSLTRLETAPAILEVARALLKSLATTHEAIEADETTAQALRSASKRSLESASRRLQEQSLAVEQSQRDLAGLKGQMTLLLSTHGDDDARAKKRLEAETLKADALLNHRATQERLRDLQPELVERDLIRLARAIKERAQERDEARTRIAVAQSNLRSEGNEDPHSAKVTAELSLRAATQHRDTAKRKTEAVALLDALFQAEQKSLSDRLTQPFADKISGYLQCIFGHDARAQVALKDNQFSELRLLRPGLDAQVYGFASLSGGAREQTAGAVRLAMAELLAEEHGGCLPVVFDDAFAYADPERVKVVQRMLDLASTRGLQVIVLTCNPADYASLGATTVSLQRHSVREVVGEKPPDQPLTSPTSIQSKRLLDTLRELGGSSGNKKLRLELGWDENTYDRVKEDLLGKGLLINGRGQGGTVTIAPGAVP